MADRSRTETQTNPADPPPDRYNPALDPPLPNVNDPGGAHAKGYSADAGPAPPVPASGPLPLAADAEVRGHVRRRDEDAVLPPTGRTETGDETSKERVIGADNS